MSSSPLFNISLTITDAANADNSVTYDSAASINPSTLTLSTIGAVTLSWTIGAGTATPASATLTGVGGLGALLASSGQTAVTMPVIETTTITLAVYGSPASIISDVVNIQVQVSEGLRSLIVPPGSVLFAGSSSYAAPAWMTELTNPNNESSTTQPNLIGRFLRGAFGSSAGHSFSAAGHTHSLSTYVFTSAITTAASNHNHWVCNPQSSTTTSGEVFMQTFVSGTGGPGSVVKVNHTDSWGPTASTGLTQSGGYHTHSVNPTVEYRNSSGAVVASSATTSATVPLAPYYAARIFVVTDF